MRRFCASLLIVVPALLVSVEASAGTMEVRQTSCPEPNPPAEDDTCHETIAAAIGALLAYDPPSASNPGLVDIGPGNFDTILCLGNFSHVTFRGVSRTTTTVAGVSIGSCPNLGFETLAVKNSVVGVVWGATGSSNWKYVDVVAPKPWVDSGCNATAATSHTMHGVRWIGSLPTDYGARITCGTISFELGEIRMSGQGTAPGPTSPSRYALTLAGRGKLSISKSAIRVGPGTWPSNTDWGLGVVALSVGRVFGAVPVGTPTLVLRDSVLNVDMGKILRANATAIETVGAQAAVSTPGTGFLLKRGSQPSNLWPARLVIGGNHAIESNFLWPASSTPPQIRSVDRADTFVETDCDHADPTGSCSNGETSHLMEYRAGQCGSTDPWYDVVRRACRERPPG